MKQQESLQLIRGHLVRQQIHALGQCHGHADRENDLALSYVIDPFDGVPLPDVPARQGLLKNVR